MYEIDQLLALPYDKRKQAFQQIVAQRQELWILADADGAVMLVAEDEDCIPVWPSRESAEVWQDSEWQHCEAQSISVIDWQARWTSGMTEDDLCVVIFPIPGEAALTTFPDEFDSLITKSLK